MLNRFFHDLIQDVTDKFNLKPEPVVMINIFKAAVAVMTWRDQDLGTSGFGCKQLLGLDPVAMHAGVLKWGPQLITPPPAPQQ